ncbi:hypothetical protein ES703_48916 [subsurface metagenome]
MPSDCKTRITQAQVKSQEASTLVKGDGRSWWSSEGSTEIQGAYTGSGPVLEAGPALFISREISSRVRSPGADPGADPAGRGSPGPFFIDLQKPLTFQGCIVRYTCPGPGGWSCRRWNVHSGDKQVKNTTPALALALVLPFCCQLVMTSSGGLLPWIPAREADRDGPWGVVVVLSGPIGQHPGQTGLKRPLLAFQGVNLG